MSFDPAVKRQLLLNTVTARCAEDPTLVPEIIQAATEGVRAFASRQSDVSSKIAFAMTDVLNEHKGGTEHFTRTDLLDLLNPCLEGTAWMKQQRAQLAERSNSNE